MYTVLVVVQVILAVSVIGLILLQHGKGADAGAAFGSGASGSVFGARGAATFLSHSTAGLAALFFIISLVLAILVARGAGERQSITKTLVDPASTAAQVVPEEDAGSAIESSTEAVAPAPLEAPQE